MADGRVLRRRGRWTYVDDPMNGRRWRLDGTNLDLEFDDLDRGGPLRGAWRVWINGHDAAAHGIDHFLDGSMHYVEESVDDPESFSGKETWAVAAREQLARGCHHA